jgi:sugar fermentation stimulation protein A
VDARVPNHLAAFAIAQGAVPELDGWKVVRREAVWGRGRIDFLLSRGERSCLLEVKSVTLVTDDDSAAPDTVRPRRLARFPDAPTLRGARHLAELANAVSEGLEAAVWFLVLRPDAEAFMPNDATDPAFGAALRRAAAEGVRILAHRCRLDLEGITLDVPLPISL